MLIAVIVVAVVAVGLLVLYLSTKSSAAEFRAQAGKREEELITERDQLSAARSELETQLAAAREEHQREAAEQAQKLASSAEEISRLEARNTELTDESTEQKTKLDEQTEEISNLVSETFALKNRIEEVEAVAAAANARNAGIVVGDVVDLGASQPQTLWDLEVKRSERTWRNSVAPNPDATTTPFEGADDPVKVAVEIEAAALRENVGAFITIDWRADPITDPARRHLVVRVAQEMLEAAARSPEASRLVVSQVSADDADPGADTGSAAAAADSDGADTDDAADGAADGDGDTASRQGSEIKLRLEPAGEDEVINIIPPRITSDLIDVRDETTVVVTAPSAD